jgi:hypothetical protein
MSELQKDLTLLVVCTVVWGIAIVLVLPQPWSLVVGVFGGQAIGLGVAMWCPFRRAP